MRRQERRLCRGRGGSALYEATTGQIDRVFEIGPRVRHDIDRHPTLVDPNDWTILYVCELTSGTNMVPRPDRAVKALSWPPEQLACSCASKGRCGSWDVSAFDGPLSVGDI